MDHERFRNLHGNSGSLMQKVSFQIALKSKKQIAEGTWAYVFEKPDGFRFNAGQHVRMTLINPPETDREGNSRFFSLASSPQEADLVIAMRMRDTAFKRVLGQMRIGNKLLIEMLLKSPHGTFALQDDASKPAVFLIGGIGIVPAFSMIKDVIERKLPRTIFLFYSNRRPEDAPFLGELENLAKQNPSFRLIATMTQPEKSARSWQGETGFIDRTMLTKYMHDLQSPMYYIAGLPEMVAAMKKLLADSGVSENNIRAEEFAGFTMAHKEAALAPTWKKHLLLVAIALVIVAMLILHIVIAVSIHDVGVGAFSLENPIVYIVIGLLLVLAAFKVKHLLSFKQKKAEQRDSKI